MGLMKAVEKFDYKKGNKLQYLLHLVEQSGDNPRYRRYGEDHPCAGTYGGDHQQDSSYFQDAAAGAGKRTYQRRDRKEDEHACG